MLVKEIYRLPLISMNEENKLEFDRIWNNIKIKSKLR